VLAYIRIATIFMYMYVCGAFTLSFDRKDEKSLSRNIRILYRFDGANKLTITRRNGRRPDRPCLARRTRDR